ncbi:metal-binding protein [Intrasporangium oryzae NRRL B-24470]|uniref:Metal-binding protein n=1 Tax=Intrasporangium oryzae NRRL B-24470 TaxID=1386089 RepID=W9G7T0_9MICO|nr:CHAD domain-containing protein [Intrasporangium oryzae]EWT02070.1 metal-binding protein [Intrasporangium oryzae NRRL B-24470]
MTTPHGDEAEAPTGSAGQLLRDLLTSQSAELRRRDEAVRASEPGSVHAMRIAARRLRSTLTTYRPLLDREQTDPLREELRWLGQTLARARDAQVLAARFDALLDAEDPDLLAGPVRERIDATLRAAYDTGLEEGRQALLGERHARLLEGLARLAEAPPLLDDATGRARPVVRRLLRRDTKRLRKAVRAVESVSDPTERDLALHEARKKSKRARYGAESAVPVLGARATRYAVSAKRVQDALGEHQDTVVARQWLREFAATAHAAGEDTFTYGRLHAFEQERAAVAVRDFEGAWKALNRKKIRRVLKG